MFQHCQPAEQVNIVNIVNECFNFVTELIRSPPHPKPEQLDEKCLVKNISDKNQIYISSNSEQFVDCRLT